VVDRKKNKELMSQENDWNYATGRERRHYKIHRMCHHYLNFVNCWKEFSKEAKGYKNLEHIKKTCLEINEWA
jgi:hypothetical protein